jgi:hypothetical protein
MSGPTLVGEFDLPASSYITYNNEYVDLWPTEAMAAGDTVALVPGTTTHGYKHVQKAEATDYAVLVGIVKKYTDLISPVQVQIKGVFVNAKVLSSVAAKDRLTVSGTEGKLYDIDLVVTADPAPQADVRRVANDAGIGVALTAAADIGGGDYRADVQLLDPMGMSKS